MSDEPKTKTRAKIDVVADLFTVAAAYEGLAQKSDVEIAQLLEDHVWAETSMLSPVSALLEQAIERLRRSEAGPCIDDGKDD